MNGACHEISYLSRLLLVSCACAGAFLSLGVFLSELSKAIPQLRFQYALHRSVEDCRESESMRFAGDAIDAADTCVTANSRVAMETMCVDTFRMTDRSEQLVAAHGMESRRSEQLVAAHVLESRRSITPATLSALEKLSAGYPEGSVQRDDLRWLAARFDRLGRRLPPHSERILDDQSKPPKLLESSVP